MAARRRDTAYVARDVSSLYTAAKRTMDSGDYEQAAKLFDEVERQHPYSVWARRAQLMSAFNYYLAQKYTDAVSSAQRFVTIHPGNAEAPYAQYLIAHELLSADRRRHPRPDDHAAGVGCVRRADPPLSRQPLCRRRAAQARPHQGPSRRQGDGDRPLLPALRPVARGDLSLPHRRRPVSDHQPRARGARAAGRMLSRARRSRGGAEGRRGARPQLSRNPPGTGSR